MTESEKVKSSLELSFGNYSSSQSYGNPQRLEEIRIGQKHFNAFRSIVLSEHLVIANLKSEFENSLLENGKLNSHASFFYSSGSDRKTADLFLIF